MKENKLPQDPQPEKAEGAVDFSDLGPLFDPPAPEEPQVSPEEPAEEVISREIHPEAPAQEAPDEECPREISEEEVPEVSEEELPQEACEEPVTPGDVVSSEIAPEDTGEEIPASGENVDFSDLGPLFSPEGREAAPEGTVLPGEAAWLLKKLSELPQEEPEEEVSQEIPAEEVPEELSQEQPEEAAAPETEEEVNEASEEDAPEEETASEEGSGEEAPEEAPQEEPLQGAGYHDETDNQEFDEMLKAEPQEEPIPTHSRPARKGRPKRKKGEGFFGIPNLVVTAVWIAITILIGVTLGRMLWVCAADVLAFGREDKPVTITIYEADTIDDITQKLYEGELIRYPGLFKLYASLAVDEGEIHPGIWDLNTRYDYHALVNMMSPSSSRDVIELMIPEGYSCRQIFALMEENKICTALDLASYAAEGELDEYWFLEGVERGDMYSLEGFLFPDTYQFYKNDSPRNVLQKMLDNFDRRFDETMIPKIDALNATLADLMRKGGHDDGYIQDHRFDIRDVITVASLVEKETSSAEEGYKIASVIYNRLYNWGGTPAYLNIDASIVYALGGHTDLTREDLEVDSPYNTYTHTGLTPGPIANPGMASILAALEPADTDYYFYVLDPAAGSHRFTTTLDEHNAAKASIGG